MQTCTTETAKERLSTLRDSSSPGAMWWIERNVIYFNKSCLPANVDPDFKSEYKRERPTPLDPTSRGKAPRSQEEFLKMKQQHQSNVPAREPFNVYHHPAIRPVLLHAVKENGLTPEGKYKIPYIIALGSKWCPFNTDDWSSTFKIEPFVFTPTTPVTPPVNAPVVDAPNVA